MSPGQVSDVVLDPWMTMNRFASMDGMHGEDALIIIVVIIIIMAIIITTVMTNLNHIFTVIVLMFE